MFYDHLHLVTGKHQLSNKCLLVTWNHQAQTLSYHSLLLYIWGTMLLSELYPVFYFKKLRKKMFPLIFIQCEWQEYYSYKHTNNHFIFFLISYFKQWKRMPYKASLKSHYLFLSPCVFMLLSENITTTWSIQCSKCACPKFELSSRYTEWSKFLSKGLLL